MIEGIEMARDAIGLKGISLEDLSKEILAASDLGSINVENGTFENAGKVLYH